MTVAAHDLARFELADQVIPPDEPTGRPSPPPTRPRWPAGTPVIVIDGRPRYHVADCLHLLGRSVQRLPVREAAELGFTPCAPVRARTRLLRT